MFEIPGKVLTVDLPLGPWRDLHRAKQAASLMKLENFIEWHNIPDGSVNEEFRSKK